MANAIWQLYRTNEVGDLIVVANCESLSAATKRIIEIEAIPVRGLFFQLHVSADPASDDEVLGHLEYRGKHGGYVIKRQSH